MTRSRIDASRPCIVLAEAVQQATDEDIVSGDAWVRALERCGPELKGVILPLQFADAGWHLVDFAGLELLQWTRWSLESGRDLPVFALSDMPLEEILRQRPTLLLTHEWTRFGLMPEAEDEALPIFVEEAQKGTAAPDGLSWDVVSRIPEPGSHETSHHDLANEFYGAFRLWKGYLRALRDASKRDDAGVAVELARADAVRWPWLSSLDSKLRHPRVRMFQAQAQRMEFPAYPPLDGVDPQDLVVSHASQGLPPSTRVLLVDDEFTKGVGDVLLNILFKTSQFTARTAHEWVYSEQSAPDGAAQWARFVCVDSADRALEWLRYWDILPRSKEQSTSAIAWSREWAQYLGVTLEPTATKDPVDVLGFARNSASIDTPSARPEAPTTIVLLDLRLDATLRLPVYAASQLESIKFRTQLKSSDASIPVIMFTASRQAMNLMQVMSDSSDADGWLVKEAPDIPADDSNSALAAGYLLERVHLFSQLVRWYRDSLDWDSARKLEYARWYNSPAKDQTLDYVSARATAIVGAIVAGATGWKDGQYPTYFGYIEQHTPVLKFDVEQVLVARRVAVATLLWTCIVDQTRLKWDATAFNELLPGSPQKRVVKAVYDKLNFNRVLWLRSRDIHTQLMQEEVDWLREIAWPTDKQDAIKSFLSQAQADIDDSQARVSRK